MLPPLLGSNMLDHHLPRLLLQIPLNKPRIPEFGRDAEVFAAPHQGVGFAAFGGGGDAVGVEVLLFAAGDGDEAVRGGVRYVDVRRVGRGREGLPSTSY